MNSDDAQAIVPDVMKVVLEANPTMYSDRSLSPRILFPDDPFGRPWPVDSRWTRACIAVLCYQKSLYPSPAVVGQVIKVLEGLAWKKKRSVDDTGMLDVYMQEPVVEALENLMVDRPCYICSAKELLATLGGQGDSYTFHARWPKSPGALTRRLREQLGILNEIGLDVKTKHKRTGTEVTVKKVRSTV